MSTPPAPYPEERRLATVLFADIEGFTQISEQMDFELVSDLIKAVWQRVDAVLEKHGGYIDKHIGDAVMAVWGAPRAAEDDAERALTAALALQSALREFSAHSNRPGASELLMRVGVNTGPVLAGYVGTRGEYTVMGDTVNVASRLETSAESGTVVISESTYRLVRGAFRVFFRPGRDDDTNQEKQTSEPQPVDQRIDENLKGRACRGDRFPIHEQDIKIISER